MGIYILHGAAMGPIWPMLIGIGTSSFRARSGTVASILASSGGLAATIIPVVFGWISTWAGFYGGFWLLVVISALGFCTIWFGMKTQRSAL